MILTPPARIPPGRATERPRDPPLGTTPSICPVDSPEEPHGFAETQPVGLSLEIISERSFADHEEPNASRFVPANEL